MSLSLYNMYSTGLKFTHVGEMLGIGMKLCDIQTVGCVSHVSGT